MQPPNPRNLFQQKVSSVLSRESRNSPVFENIFRLQQMLALEKVNLTHGGPSNTSWKVLLELYNELGSAQFAKVIAIIRGETVSFPSEEEYQDSIVTTLCYYYREVESLTWEAVKEKLEMPKLNTIKYGIRVRQLKSFIDSSLLRSIEAKGIL